MLQSIPSPSIHSIESNPFRHFASIDLLKERECYQFSLAEIDANPDDWSFPGESRKFIAMRLSDIVSEIGRRKRLVGKPNAPGWPQRDPIEMKEELEEIKYRLELAKYIETFAEVTLEKQGRSLWCCCPLPGHNDNHASFHVDPDKQIWYCFGCGRGGDVFEFARQFYSIGEFWRVAEMTRTQAGMEEPKPPVTGPGILTADGQTLSVSVAPRRSRSGYGRRS